MLAKFLMFENRLVEQNQSVNKVFYWLNQSLLLALRIWLFNVFFFSGWLKMTSWDTTIMLFEYEYSVPIISPILAAYLATAAELIFPSLLLAGIFSRFSAMSLIVLNFIAATSYADISAAGNQQHILWGGMLLVLFVSGAGKINPVDYLLNRGRARAL